MFCTHCGNEMKEGTAFCGRCGQPVGSRAPEAPAAPAWTPPPAATYSPPPAAYPPPPQGGYYAPPGYYAQPAPRSGAKPLLKRIAAVGGPLVILCFFLPWLFASCTVSSMLGGEAQGFNVSGLEIATGDYRFLDQISSLAGMYGGDTSQMGDMNLEAKPFVFLVPLLGLVGLAALNGRASGQFVAAAAGVLGVITMIVIGSQLGKVMDDAMNSGFTIEYRLGYYGVWIGFIWMVILGLSAIFLLRNEPQGG